MERTNQIVLEGTFQKRSPFCSCGSSHSSSDSVESYHVDRYLNMLERANEVKPIVIEPTILCPLCNEEQQMEQLDFMTHAFTKHDMSRLEGEKMFFNVLKRTKKVGV
jgi:hypothetical protein